MYDKAHPHCGHIGNQWLYNGIWRCAECLHRVLTPYRYILRAEQLEGARVATRHELSPASPAALNAIQPEEQS